jgi:hypothetical protein
MSGNHRFKMSFNNYGARAPAMYNSLANNISVAPRAVPVPVKPAGLNAPMIGRVYNAKPGCSACGKKVA